MTTPDWDINIFDASQFGDHPEGTVGVSVYDRNVSSSDSVDFSTFRPRGELSEEDGWYSAQEIADRAIDGLTIEDFAWIDEAVNTAKAKHASWIAERDTPRAVASASAGGIGTARVAAGVAAGGQFTSHDRADGAVAL